MTEEAIRNGITPLLNPADDNDVRRPSEGMTADWYIKNRIQEQRDEFYRRGQERHERTVEHLRTAALGIAIVGALVGAISAVFDTPWLAPWVAVLTSLGGLLLAYGLMDRHQYLAASYAATAETLSRIPESAGGELGKLVEMTETLLESEHLKWTQRMTKSTAGPPSTSLPAKPEVKPITSSVPKL